MTRRMTQLIAGALAIVGIAIIVAAAVGVARQPAAPGEDEQPDADPRPVCHPDDAWLPHLGWPDWGICADSHGYHTCWRPQDHTGRHCAWNLATGQVEAVWPCVQLRLIGRRR